MTAQPKGDEVTEKEIEKREAQYLQERHSLAPTPHTQGELRKKIYDIIADHQIDVATDEIVALFPTPTQSRAVRNAIIQKVCDAVNAQYPEDMARLGNEIVPPHQPSEGWEADGEIRKILNQELRIAPESYRDDLHAQERDDLVIEYGSAIPRLISLLATARREEREELAGQVRIMMKQGEIEHYPEPSDEYKRGSKIALRMVLSFLMKKD